MSVITDPGLVRFSLHKACRSLLASPKTINQSLYKHQRPLFYSIFSKLRGSSLIFWELSCFPNVLIYPNFLG